MTLLGITYTNILDPKIRDIRNLLLDVIRREFIMSNTPGIH